MGRTKKVKIAGKYGARYGTSIRKKVAQIEAKQKAKYLCVQCLKQRVKRKSIGIWYCSKCNKDFTGGAYSFSTKPHMEAVATVSRLIEAQKQTKTK